jgi:hypothetical protein
LFSSRMFAYKNSGHGVGALAPTINMMAKESQRIHSGRNHPR